MEVRLSADEGLAATSVAALQMMRATQKGWVGNDHGGQSGRSLRERWAQAIQGAMAEYAACKFLNKCWMPSADGIQSCDISPDIHVRATPWNNGHLIINDSEIDKYKDSKFILITGHWPIFNIRGWIKGSAAKNNKWYRPDERPASYWVPQEYLLDVQEID